jgi:hypothetical protein
MNSSQTIEQIVDLSDILELIPSCINQSDLTTRSDLVNSLVSTIRQSLAAYKGKYPTSTFDYIRYLEVDKPPEKY